MDSFADKSDNSCYSVAKKAFMAGDIIEDYCLPITKTIENLFLKDYCHHCMKNPKKLKKCPKCPQMYYCNKECQRNDWKYHKNECKVFSHQKFKIEECVSTEKLLIRLWLTIESDPNYVTEKRQLLNGTQICIKDIEINTKQLSEDNYRMVEFQEICDHFDSYGLEYERKELLRYYGFVIFNGMRHSLFHYHKDLTRNPFAIGVFLETYHSTHSCTPNTAYVNNGFALQVRAMKAIAAHELLTISFLDLAKDRAERQRTMKTFFNIDCKCVKCEQNLDSDINYSKFCADLHQIYSISNFGEIMGASLLSTIDPNEAYAMFARMTGLYCRIYGTYHPNLTAFLLQQLLAMWRLSKYLSKVNLLSNKAVIKEFHDICDTNLKVTYGVDHYLYGLFRKFEII